MSRFQVFGIQIFTVIWKPRILNYLLIFVNVIVYFSTFKFCIFSEASKSGWSIVAGSIVKCRLTKSQVATALPHDRTARQDLHSTTHEHRLQRSTTRVKIVPEKVPRHRQILRSHRQHWRHHITLWRHHITIRRMKRDWWNWPTPVTGS